MKALTTLSVSLVFLLSGCDNAERRAATEARTKFRESLAAMKVSGQNPNEPEFRQQRLALESCYQANRKYLEGPSATAFIQLVQTMRDCESISFPTLTRQSNALYQTQSDVYRAREIHQNEMLALIEASYANLRPATAVGQNELRIEMLNEQLKALKKLRETPLTETQSRSITKAQAALAGAGVSLRTKLNSIDQQCDALIQQLEH